MAEKSYTLGFPQIVVKTMFSFMVCDGSIAPHELIYIKKVTENNDIFKDVNVDEQLDEMIRHLNDRGVDYLEAFFKKIKHAALTEEEELLLLDSAIQTIQSDKEIKQDEINFLRVLRTVLKVSNEKIEARFPQFAKDFVTKDPLTAAYISEIYENYFNQKELPKFDFQDVQDITDAINLGPGAKK